MHARARAYKTQANGLENLVPFERDRFVCVCDKFVVVVVVVVREMRKEYRAHVCPPVRTTSSSVITIEM